MSLSFLEVCRVCLSAGSSGVEDFLQLDKPCNFVEDDQTTFYEIYNFCTKLQASTADGLPPHICRPCMGDLENSYNFLKRVFASEEKLRNIKGNEVNEITAYKDPLENVTDEENNGGENIESKQDISENFNDASHMKLIVPDCENTTDKEDNIFEDFTHSPSPFLPPPLYPDDVPTSGEDSEDDNDDSDFLISIESQIFPQGRFKCAICDKFYFTTIGLNAHMEVHEPKTKTISKPSTSNGSRKRRRRKQKAATTTTDDSEEETQREPVKKEAKEVIPKTKDTQPKPKKTYPCNICGKEMISASKLRYHMVMHTGEKDYLCTMCPKAYSTIYALKHHMRAHTGERPYECKFCGDRFLRPTTLKSHMRRHTGERPYGCEICGKRFIQHSSMATHMKLNHMDKTIACPYCDKKYARQTDLNVHLLSHSGDKPFACKQCPSRFTRQSNLNKHMHQQHNQGTETTAAAKGKYTRSTTVTTSTATTTNPKLEQLSMNGGIMQAPRPVVAISNSSKNEIVIPNTSDFDKFITPSWPLDQT
ncbi:uncharacterized protein [Musca autumnalis]|uniref:uncharacterized protein n=1 Tax=Musca autumnalis TaxID=221902 RepID=UPI003CEBEB82